MVIFEIMGVREKDEGKYTCVAKNKAGKAESSFNLKFSNIKTKSAPRFITQIKVVLLYQISIVISKVEFLVKVSSLLNQRS